MSGDTDFEHKILHKLGEISGELRGLHSLVATHEQSMNRRMDDVVSAANERFAALGRRVKQTEEDIRGIVEAIGKVRTQMLVLSAASGGTAAGVFEGLTRMFGAG